ncbi:MAG: hypothetical protein ACRDHP_12885, partial [Ktedonobacterales bacterium]
VMRATMWGTTMLNALGILVIAMFVGLFLVISSGVYEFAVVRTLRKYPPERRFARICEGVLRLVALTGILRAVSTAIAIFIPPNSTFSMSHFLLNWLNDVVLIAILFIPIGLYRHFGPRMKQWLMQTLVRHWSVRSRT